MSDYKVLLAAESEGVLTVTLNRPYRLNALTDELMTALLGAFKSAALSASVLCCAHGRGQRLLRWAGPGCAATRQPSFAARPHARSPHSTLARNGSA
jgi:hypothetical protein